MKRNSVFYCLLLLLFSSFVLAMDHNNDENIKEISETPLTPRVRKLSISPNGDREAFIKNKTLFSPRNGKTEKINVASEFLKIAFEVNVEEEITTKMEEFLRDYSDDSTENITSTLQQLHDTKKTNTQQTNFLLNLLLVRVLISEFMDNNECDEDTCKDLNLLKEKIEKIELLDVEAAEKLTIPEIIGDPLLKKQFKLLLEKEKNNEPIICYELVKALLTLLFKPGKSIIQARTSAEFIFDNYIKANSENELNITNEVRTRIAGALVILKKMENEDYSFLDTQKVIKEFLYLLCFIEINLTDPLYRFRDIISENKEDKIIFSRKKITKYNRGKVALKASLKELIQYPDRYIYMVLTNSGKKFDAYLELITEAQKDTKLDLIFVAAALGLSGQTEAAHWLIVNKFVTADQILVYLMTNSTELGNKDIDWLKSEKPNNATETLVAVVTQENCKNQHQKLKWLISEFGADLPSALKQVGMRHEEGEERFAKAAKILFIKGAKATEPSLEDKDKMSELEFQAAKWVYTKWLVYEMDNNI